MIHFIAQHEFWSGIIAYWVFSAAVSAMPTPNGSSQGYEWLFKFLHTIAGNLTNAFAAKIPGLNGGNNGPGTPANH